MPRRDPPAATRAWSVVVTTAVLLLVLTLVLPGATSAAQSAPPSADPSLVRALLSTGDPLLVPFAPDTAPAGGGRTLTLDQRRELTAWMDALGEERGADFGLAVQDLRTGATFSHNAHRQFPMASVAKLTILAMLLLHAQEEGRDLTEQERAQAEVMIRYSDNEVTDGLYSRIGFTDGFVHGARAFGLTGTDPHPRGVWGATMTTAADQVRLLRALYSEEGPLSESDRLYLRGLMESVAAEQAWGVSACAGPHDTVGLKNGWTPRESNRGLWNVNSVGYVVGPDREYLVAVLSDGNSGYTSGVELVEEVVSTVTDALEEAAS